MSVASLLTRNDRWFVFEHAMAHRRALGIMAPLSRFTAVPYFIDPEQYVDQPASFWHINHQQAHRNALANFPIQYGSASIGLRIGTTLSDADLADEREARWWEFQNHVEHYVGNKTITPGPAPPPAPQTKYPFW